MAAYYLRLLCLCLACFFLVHLALGVAVLLLTNAAVGLAERMRARTAARFLLALRLLPSGFALLLVLAVFTPSYLWLEPANIRESAGLRCIALAALGATVWSLSLARTVRAAARSHRQVHDYQQRGRELSFQDSALRIWEIEGRAPLVILAGILHSRLIVSYSVVESLTPEQLSAVLNHEEVHSRSRDNLKRLLVMLSPGMIPCYRGFAALERGWANVVEWAADDGAAAGDSERSVTLASALVQVARLGAAPVHVPLVTSLMADGLELSTRVDRLLRTPSEPAQRRGAGLVWGSAGALAAVALLVVLLRPATLYTANAFLEALIR